MLAVMTNRLRNSLGAIQSGETDSVDQHVKFHMKAINGGKFLQWPGRSQTCPTSCFESHNRFLFHEESR
jgi:hypothetical protein